jgi:hypothetical protein
MEQSINASLSTISACLLSLDLVTTIPGLVKFFCLYARMRAWIWPKSINSCRRFN